MKYTGATKQNIGDSGHIIDMMSAVLSNNQSEPEAKTSYCAYNIDYLERECETCNLCNYNRDCHNNMIL